jgi:hypothetical protein
MVRIIVVLLIALFFGGNSVHAQVIHPVKWGFSVNKINNAESELVFTATVDKGWNIYSQNIEEGGPIPTTFNFDKGMGYMLVGKVTEPEGVEKMDNVFNMKVIYLSGKVEFRQKVRVMSLKPVKVTGNVEFMCCDDEQCLPPEEVPFSFELPPSN